MKTTRRWRTLAGVYVTWNKTGTSGGDLNYDVGDWKCAGCDRSRTDVAASLAESHSRVCREE